MDIVIKNAEVIDYTGIFKADVGIKAGLIVSLGKAGNPDVMDGVSENMIIGVSAGSHSCNRDQLRSISQAKHL